MAAACSEVLPVVKMLPLTLGANIGRTCKMGFVKEHPLSLHPLRHSHQAALASPVWHCPFNIFQPSLRLEGTTFTAMLAALAILKPASLQIATWLKRAAG